MTRGEANSIAAWPVLLLATLQIMSWVSTNGRRLPPEHHLGQPQGTQHSSWEEKQAPVDGEEEMEEAAASGELKRMGALGSTPPSCRNRCGGCVPCAAIQVPATMHRLGVQYSNYEPEDWKCKCGSAFYNP